MKKLLLSSIILSIFLLISFASAGVSIIYQEDWESSNTWTDTTGITSIRDTTNIINGTGTLNIDSTSSNAETGVSYKSITKVNSSDSIDGKVKLEFTTEFAGSTAVNAYYVGISKDIPTDGATPSNYIALYAVNTDLRIRGATDGTSLGTRSADIANRIIFEIDLVNNNASMYVNGSYIDSVSSAGTLDEVNYVWVGDYAGSRRMEDATLVDDLMVSVNTGSSGIPMSANLLYPINGGNYYGTYNGSITFDLSNVNVSASCTINDSRWTLHGGPTFENETVHYLNNTLITDRTPSVFIQCNDSSDQINLSVSWNSNLIPTTPTNIVHNSNFNLLNNLQGNASGSIDANNDSLTYYYKFYNLEDSILLQNWSTNNTYVLQSSDMFDNISISAKAYDGTNYSSEYSMTAVLPNVTVYAYNTLTNGSISSINMSTDYKNYSLSSGDIINLNYGTFNFTFDAIQFASSTNEYTINSSNQNISAYLDPYLTFRIYNEPDGTPFDTNETDRTAVTYYCVDQTESYELNLTANQNSIYAPVGCVWEFIKLDIEYSSNIYYRAIMPAEDEEIIDFYALDLTENTGVEIIFILNDLVGDFTGGNLIITSIINNSEQVIHQQPFDAESKVTTYLWKNAYYTLKLESADQTQTRNIGIIIASSAGEKTLTVPELDFVPEVVLDDDVSFSWTDSNSSQIKLVYTDTGGLTSQLDFTIYNASNTSQVIYTTQSLNLNGVYSYTYMTAQNQSYLACFEATHSTLGTLEECKFFLPNLGGEHFDDFTGWTDDEAQKIKNIFTVLILCIVIMIGAIYVPETLAIVIVIEYLAIKTGWLYFTPTINNGIMVLTGIMAALSFFIKRIMRT